MTEIEQGIQENKEGNTKDSLTLTLNFFMQDSTSGLEIDDVLALWQWLWPNKIRGKTTGKPYDDIISIVSDTKSDKSEKMSVKSRFSK